MGVADDQDGYGFARRGMPSRKKIGRRTAVPAGPPPSGQSRLPHQPAYAEDYAPGSKRKPAWVWLLIGVLLGTGGTLMAASFWLPEGGNREIAKLEARSDGRTLPAQETEPKQGTTSERRTASELQTTETERKTAVAGKVPETLAADDVTASPPVSPTKVASVETVAPDIEKVPNGSAAMSVTAPEPVSSEVVPPEPAQNDEKPKAATASEQLLPIPADVIADIERRPADTGSSQPSPDPETALAALVSEGASASTPPPQRPQDTATITTPAAAAPAVRNQPPPGPGPVASTATVDDQVPPADDPASPANTAARPPATSEDATSRRVAESAELPPRIRQALAKAGIAPGTAGAGKGERLYRVQLAAVDNESAARIYWREITTRLPGVFTDVEPIFDQRMVDERLYLRIWVGAFDNRGDADGYCGWLKQQGQDCFVTRVDKL